MERKRLVRSERHRLLAGVCGGLAEYFGLDVNLVRLIALVLVVVQPVFALVYLLLVFVLPREGEEERPLEARVSEGVREIEEGVRRITGENEPSKLRFYGGLALVVLGLWLLLENLGLWWIDGSLLGALLLIALGVYFLLPKGGRG
ncbi:PspC domain protein [Oceanithermus profundus DSM 14977]|uniref:PspC domain protein n=1 Tax=Oceanithermus profundus (strain DSM 14977 / NBRC 100410 / VKM B-2274 / 506) TaxID=670487 RepID=E4U7N3_OCEP5|nr:PspC domain-containing protein [Oceanithermus profundus]ADR36482.1 PspC domain protein [Oceanithermus profundus DSM 14977]